VTDCRSCPAANSDPDRRRFLAQAALAAAGLLTAGACGDGVIGGPLGPREARPLPNALVVQLADFPSLAVVGGSARVDPGTSTPIAVTRTGTASFVALSMICPHASYRPIQIVGTGFRCPNHGAEFDETGNWTGGQRTTDLRAYGVVYDETAGTLTIS
jgi:thiosulfate dehydrogenase [quinone] large subunit